jgi:hypothetical protein
VLATLLPSRIGSVLDEVRALAARWRVALAGAGVTPELAEEAGTEYLAGGPLEAAERLAQPSLRR